MVETGKRLKDFRISKHLTLAELSMKTGLSVGMLSETEGGRNKPSPNLMIALYRLYNLNINWLLTGEGEVDLKKNIQMPPINENGELIYNENTLSWFMERVPMVKYSMLAFFASYYLENRNIIEKYFHEVSIKNSSPNKDTSHDDMEYEKNKKS
jgi:transcriptional regulator with XRE-family HTH domain